MASVTESDGTDHDDRNRNVRSCSDWYGFHVCDAGFSDVDDT